MFAIVAAAVSVIIVIAVVFNVVDAFVDMEFVLLPIVVVLCLCIVRCRFFYKKYALQRQRVNNNLKGREKKLSRSLKILFTCKHKCFRTNNNYTININNNNNEKNTQQQKCATATEQ